MYQQRQFLGQDVNNTQYQVIQRIRRDPNYTSDLSEIQNAVNAKVNSITVLSPDPYKANRINVYQKLPRSHRDVWRSLEVTPNGEILVFDRDKKVNEDINLYLFSDLALELFDAIKKKGFYDPVLQRHPDSLELRYSSQFLGKVFFEEETHNLTEATYSLWIDKHGNMKHILYYDELNNYGGTSAGYCTFDNVDSIPDPQYKEFIKTTILPMDIKMDVRSGLGMPLS